MYKAVGDAFQSSTRQYADGSLGFPMLHQLPGFSPFARRYSAKPSSHTPGTACPPGYRGVRDSRGNPTCQRLPPGLHAMGGAFRDGSLGATAALVPQLTRRPSMPSRRAVSGSLGSVYRDGVLGDASVTTPGGTVSITEGPQTIALPWYKTPLGIGAGVAAGAGVAYLLLKKR